MITIALLIIAVSVFTVAGVLVYYLSKITGKSKVDAAGKSDFVTEEEYNNYMAWVKQTGGYNHEQE